MANIVPLNDILAKLPVARRATIKANAVKLLAQVRSLEALRKARSLTQVQVAKELGIAQNSVSTLERRADLLVSTLRKYIEAAGGELTLIAKFPSGEQFNLTAFGEALGFEEGVPIPEHKEQTPSRPRTNVNRTGAQPATARGKSRIVR